MKNNIRIERAKKGWTQEDLATEIGVSRQSVNSIESGRFVPSTLLALKMARAFGVAVEELFELDADE